MKVTTTALTKPVISMFPPPVLAPVSRTYG